ncbi:DUF2171 domain-containing protein [Nonomuraea wenchangensis]|uniref:PRC-barrel domain-containing protein n=1 Tax=Nonomuraea wenchangensis TaxID=568860 RepID=A0A1I0KLB9_9ACTN|nr:DUF2171 domain-containing protein [Nonomuraea wenchangensis]SEU26015.1 hypothetical protein SAMN05421811_108357 [Nonomuraea wenchangensis]
MQIPQRPGISQVHTGMKVVDRDGKEVGTVELVKMGDPQAATTDGQQPGRSPGFVPVLSDVFGHAEPDLPPALAARLLRTGFVKVDGRGLFARDLYVAPEQVARIEDNVVHLSTDGGSLAKES